MSEPQVPPLSPQVRRALQLTIIVGAFAFAVGLARAPQAAWSSFLTSSFFFMTIALGAVVFIALGHVGAAGWSSVLRRVAEALAAWLPLGALAMLAVLVGVPQIYHWAAPHAADDPILVAKSAYLNLPFFAARMVIVLAIWLFFSWLLTRESRRQDADGALVHTRRSVAISAMFLVLFGLSFSVASFDWVMSLEPHWASTIFGLYNIAGLLLATVGAITVVAIVLRRAGAAPAITENHLHDLGKYLFGFSTLWAYLWFSQYLLIWYANLPEEGTYYLARTRGGWSFLFYFNFIAGWVIPFLALLPRRAKRSERHLLLAAVWVLGARWLDVYLMTMPANMPMHTGIGLLDLALLLAFGAGFVLVVARALSRTPLLPKNDPYLVEGLHHRV